MPRMLTSLSPVFHQSHWQTHFLTSQNNWLSPSLEASERGGREFPSALWSMGRRCRKASVQCSATFNFSLDQILFLTRRPQPPITPAWDILVDSEIMKQIRQLGFTGTSKQLGCLLGAFIQPLFQMPGPFVGRPKSHDEARPSSDNITIAQA